MSRSSKPESSKSKKNRRSAPKVVQKLRRSLFETLERREMMAQLSIQDAVAVTEGQSAAFVLSLDSAASQDVTVYYQTQAGTASTSDYGSANTSAVISAGYTTKTIYVATTDDSLDEPDESFSVSLSSATNATIYDGSASGTILDNDAAPSVSIGDAGNVTEGQSAAFTLSLTSASGQDVTVYYQTQTGTAGTSDYTPTTASAVISAGYTSKTIYIATTDDSANEPDETFSVSLTSATNATIYDGSGYATIKDNDAASGVSVSIGDAGNVTEGQSAAFTLTLSSLSSSNVTVYYQTQSGTAGTSDYTPTTASAVISAGYSSKTIYIPTTDDSANEPDETFSVSLTSATGATINDGSGFATIIDNDSPPAISVSIGDAGNVTEGQSAAFTLTLSSLSSSNVTVYYQTQSGTAGTSDYTPTTASAVISAGYTSKTIYIPTTDDSANEPDETFSVSLTSATGATINDGSGYATIIDNDAPAISVNIGDAGNVTEGQSAAFALTLSSVSSSNVTVYYQTQTGTAGTSDYTPTTASAVISAGYTTKTIYIATTDDSADEPDETFSVSLTSATGATINDGSGFATIIDNDPPVSNISVSIGDAGNVTEGQSAAFTLTLTAASTQNTTIYYQTQSGTAGTYDYTATNSSAVISASYTTKTIYIATTDDSADEPDETFSVSLTSAVGATVNDGIGSATIIDNDAPVNQAPQTTADTYSVVEGNALTISAPGLLANDNDPESEPLHVASVTAPVHGSLTWNSNGGFTYTPTTGYTGYDWFTYVASDGALSSSTTSVTIAVTPYRPEIEITLGGNNVTDNSGTVTFSDSTVKTFTVKNVGAAPLTLTPSSLVAPTGFTIVTSSLPTSLAAGGSATFTVQMTTTSGGNYSGTLSLTNNDADEGPFEIALSGTVNACEITVEDGTGANVLDGVTTVSLGSMPLGAPPLVHTFKVRNTGTQTLTLSPQSLTLPTGYALVTPFASSVQPGQWTSFTIKLSASAVGDYTGAVSFATNDADENPFNFTIAGQISGVVAATVAGLALVNDTGISATDGVTSDPTVRGVVNGSFFGSVDVEFDHNGDSVKDGASTVYVPGFDFTYAPASAEPSLLLQEGVLPLRYRLMQYDAGRNLISVGAWQAWPTTITLEHPPAAEIELRDSGDNLVLDGVGQVDFGNAPLGTNVSRTITIKNTGVGPLQIATGSFTLPSGFTLTTAPAASVAAGSQTTFTVQLSGAAAGSYDGQISFLTSDEDERTFNFRLSGNVVAAKPEITLLSPIGRELQSGDSFTFGATILGEPIDRTFTLRNTGSLPLTTDALGTSLPSGFSFVAAPAASIATGAQVAVTIRYDAIAVGSSSGTFTLANNDADEGTFTLALTASVVATGVSTIGVDGPRLLSDNGASSSDNVSDDVRITGVVNGYFGGGNVAVEFDHGVSGTVQGSASVAVSGGTFVYDPIAHDASLVSLNTSKTFRYRTVHRDDVGTVVATSSWSNFTVTRTAPVGSSGLTVRQLGLSLDTGSSSTDRVTTDPTLFAVIGGELGTNTAQIEFDHNGDHIAEGSLSFTTSDSEQNYDPRSVDPAFVPSSTAYAVGYRLVERNAAGAILAVGAWQSLTLTLQALPNSTAYASGMSFATDASGLPTIQGSVTTGSSVPTAIAWDLNNDGVMDGQVVANSSNSFSFHPALAAYGTHTVKIYARAWDASYGAFLVNPTPASYTFSWQPAAAPTVGPLTLANDTGTSATDKLTSDPTISGSVNGATIAGVKLTMEYTKCGQTLTGTTYTDGSGAFSQRQVGLTPGVWTVRARPDRYDTLLGADVIGVWSSYFTFTVETPTVPTVTQLSLVVDDGVSATDKITTNPAIVGSLGEALAAPLDVEYDLTGDGVPEGRASLDSTGAFTFTPVALAAGSHTLRVRTTRFDSNLGAEVTSNWSTAPVSLTFELIAAVHVPSTIGDIVGYRPTSTIGTGGVIVTTEAAVKGTVSAGAGSVVGAGYTLLEVDRNGDQQPDETIQTDANGAFTYVPIGATPGELHFSFRTREWDYNLRQTNFSAWKAVVVAYQPTVNDAPLVSSLTLASDTGSSQSDKVTANPLLVGQVSNSIGEKRLAVEIDYNGDGNAEALAFSDDTGEFRYKPEPLAYGTTYTIRARAVEWDATSGAYVHSLAWTALTFDYENQGNAAAKIVSLSSVVRDGKSLIEGQIVNEGELAGVTVQLDLDGNTSTIEYTTTTDAKGRFSVEPHGFSYGTLAVQARTRELDTVTGQLLFSSWSGSSLSYASPAGALASVATLALATDNGTSATDGHTTESTLIGTVVKSGGSVGSLLVQFYHDGHTTPDGQAGTDSSGRFVYAPQGLSLGAHTIVAKVKDYDGSGNAVLSAGTSAMFTLEAAPAQPTINNLSLASDTGADPHDGSTQSSSLTGHVGNLAMGQTATIEFDTNFDGAADGTATTNSSGDYTFSPSGLSMGPVTVRARLAGTSAWGTSLSFVLSSTPDSTEAQGQASAIATYTSGIQASHTTYESKIQTAKNVYQAAISAARGSYDTSFAAATQLREATVGSARASYDGILRGADATYASALASASTDYIANLAAFAGNTASFDLKSFAFADAPPDFVTSIPRDEDQPLPPSEAPKYEGHNYDPANDRTFREKERELTATYEAAKKTAEDAYNAAAATAEQTYASAVQSAQYGYGQDAAAAEAQARADRQQGSSGIDVLGEKKKFEAQSAAANQKYGREVARLDADRLAARAVVEAKYIADFNAYYAEWNRLLQVATDATTDTAKREARAAAADYHEREQGRISYVRQKSLADIDQKDAIPRTQAAFEIQTKLAQLKQAYDDKLTQHDDWVAKLNLAASLTQTKALNAAALTRDKLISAAAVTRATTLNEKAKVRDVALETAEAARWVAIEQAKLPAVDAWAESQNNPWATYQKELTHHAVEYVVALKPKITTQFTGDADAIEAEANFVAAEQKKLSDFAGDYRLTRADADADSKNAYDVAAQTADTLRGTEEHQAQAASSQRYAANMKLLNRKSADDTHWKITHQAEADREYQYDVAPLYAYWAYELIATSDGPQLLYLAGGAERDRQYASIALQDGINNSDAVHLNIKLSFENTQLLNSDLAAADAKRDTAKTVAYETYQKAVADHAASYAISYVGKYSEYIKAVSGQAKTTDGLIAAHEATLVGEDAGLQAIWASADLASENTFREAAAEEHEDIVAAWSDATDTPWSHLQVNLAGVEVSRVAGLGSKLAQHLSSTAGIVSGAIAASASRDKTLADGVSAGLDTETGEFAAALVAYVTADATARKTYQQDLAAKTATHDKTEITYNRDYLIDGFKRDAEWKTQYYPMVYASEPQFVVNQYDYDLEIVEMREEFGSNPNNINQINNALQQAAQNRATANKLDYDAAWITQQTIILRKPEQDALAKQGYVKSLGELHVGLAGDVKTLADDLAAALKTATDGLSTKQAAAAAGLVATSEDANSAYTTSSATSEATTDHEVAEVDGELEEQLTSLTNEERENRSASRSDYEVEVYSQDAVAKLAATASTPMTILDDFRNFAAGRASDIVQWASGAASATADYFDDLSQAYSQFSSADLGSGGSQNVYSDAIKSAEAEAIGRQATSESAFDKKLSEGIVKLQRKKAEAATKAIVAMAAAETSYAQARNLAQTKFNTQSAQAEAQEAADKAAAEIEYVRNQQLATSSSQSENAEDQRAARLASAANGKLESIALASEQFTAAIEQARLARVDTYNSAFSTRSQDFVNVEREFLSEHASTLGDNEQAVTATILQKTTASAEANSSHLISTSANRDAFEIAGMNAAANLAVATKPISELFSQTLADRQTAYAVAVAGRNSSRAADFFSAHPYEVSAKYAAASAQAELGWLESMATVFSTTITAKAAAAADETIANAFATVEARSSLAGATQERLVAAQALSQNRTIEQATVEREAVEDVLAVEQNEIASQSQTLSDFIYSTVASTSEYNRDVEEANLNFETGALGLAPGASSTGLAHVRDLAKANALLQKIVDNHSDKINSTTLNAAAMKESQTDRAAIIADGRASIAMIDRDYLIAMTLVDADFKAANAEIQTALWTAQTTAANLRRSGDADAAVAYTIADYAAQTAAAIAIDSMLNLPWTSYRVSLAEAKEAWWIASGRDSMLEEVDAVNVVNSSYDQTIGAAFRYWVNQAAEADSDFVAAVAASQAEWDAANAEASAAAAALTAGAAEAWLNSAAVASSDVNVARQTNQVNALISSNDTERQSADATATLIWQTSENASNRLWFMAESNTVGDQLLTDSDQRVQYTVIFAAAARANVANKTAAERAYAVAEAAAQETRDAQTEAAAFAKSVTNATTWAAAVDDLASTDPTPWSLFDAAQAAAQAARIVQTVAASEDLGDSRRNAESAFLLSESTATRDSKISVTDAAMNYLTAVVAASDTLTQDAATVAAAAASQPIAASTSAALYQQGVDQLLALPAAPAPDFYMPNLSGWAPPRANAAVMSPRQIQRGQAPVAVPLQTPLANFTAPAVEAGDLKPTPFVLGEITISTGLIQPQPISPTQSQFVSVAAPSASFVRSHGIVHKKPVLLRPQFEDGQPPQPPSPADGVHLTGLFTTYTITGGSAGQAVPFVGAIRLVIDKTLKEDIDFSLGIKKGDIVEYNGLTFRYSELAEAVSSGSIIDEAEFKKWVVGAAKRYDVIKKLSAIAADLDRIVSQEPPSDSRDVLNVYRNIIMRNYLGIDPLKTRIGEYHKARTELDLYKKEFDDKVGELVAWIGDKNLSLDVMTHEEFTLKYKEYAEELVHTNDVLVIFDKDGKIVQVISTTTSTHTVKEIEIELKRTKTRKFNVPISKLAKGLDFIWTLEGLVEGAQNAVEAKGNLDSPNPVDQLEGLTQAANALFTFGDFAGVEIPKRLDFMITHVYLPSMEAAAHAMRKMQDDVLAINVDTLYNASLGYNGGLRKAFLELIPHRTTGYFPFNSEWLKGVANEQELAILKKNGVIE